MSTILCSSSYKRQSASQLTVNRWNEWERQMKLIWMDATSIAYKRNHSISKISHQALGVYQKYQDSLVSDLNDWNMSTFFRECHVMSCRCLLICQVGQRMEHSHMTLNMFSCYLFFSIRFTKFIWFHIRRVIIDMNLNI